MTKDELIDAITYASAGISGYSLSSGDMFGAVLGAAAFLSIVVVEMIAIAWRARKGCR